MEVIVLAHNLAEIFDEACARSLVDSGKVLTWPIAVCSRAPEPATAEINPG